MVPDPNVSLPATDVQVEEDLAPGFRPEVLEPIPAGRIVARFRSPRFPRRFSEAAGKPFVNRNDDGRKGFAGFFEKRLNLRKAAYSPNENTAFLEARPNSKIKL